MRYDIAFIIALTLHIVLMCFLFIAPSHPSRPKLIVKRGSEPRIMNAVAIDTRAVVKEVKKLKQQRRAARRQQHHMVAIAKEAQRRRAIEEKRLANLKTNLKSTLQRKKHQEAMAAKALVKLQQKQKVAKQHLKHMQAERDETVKVRERETARVSALEKKRQRERARLKALEKQRNTILATREKEKARVERLAKIAKLQRQLQAAALDAQRAKSKREATESAALKGQIDKYKALVIQAISHQWIPPEKVPKNSKATLLVRLASGGTVLNVTILKSSGSEVLDRSARVAVYKASPLPVPSNQIAFDKFRTIHLTVRKEGVSS